MKYIIQLNNGKFIERFYKCSMVVTVDAAMAGIYTKSIAEKKLQKIKGLGILIEDHRITTKNQKAMKNQNFKIGQEVTFLKSYGVNVITEIKGNTAKTLEKNTGFTYTKRLSSLKPYIQQEAYWNEQELAQPIYKHGDIVFTTLSGNGNGSKMVWDDIKKECVAPENLTKNKK